jgi:hypothetical protein
MMLTSRTISPAIRSSSAERKRTTFVSERSSVARDVDRVRDAVDLVGDTRAPAAHAPESVAHALEPVADVVEAAAGAPEACFTALDSAGSDRVPCRTEPVSDRAASASFALEAESDCLDQHSFVADAAPHGSERDPDMLG